MTSSHPVTITAILLAGARPIADPLATAHARGTGASGHGSAAATLKAPRDP